MTTAGRKPLAQQVAPAIDPALDQDKIGGALAQMRADSLADIDAVVEAVHSLGVSSGASGAFEFMRCVADSGATAQFENVKKSKAWRYLDNPKYCDGRKFESVDEYCQVAFGKSYRRMQELVSNRNTLGQEAFEQAERLGLRQVDYNAIKALPAPEQELLRRAVEEAQSRDDVLDLLQELASRFVKTEAELQKQVIDLREEAETKDARRGELVTQNEKLKEQLVRIKRAGPDEALEAARAEAATILSEVLGRVRGDFRHALQVLSGMDAKEDIFLAGMVGQVAAELALLREQFDLPDLSNARDAQLAADVAKWAPQAGA